MNGRIPDNGIAGENGIRPYCIVASGTARHNDKSPHTSHLQPHIASGIIAKPHITPPATPLAPTIENSTPPATPLAPTTENTTHTPQSPTPRQIYAGQDHQTHNSACIRRPPSTDRIYRKAINNGQQSPIFCHNVRPLTHRRVLA